MRSAEKGALTVVETFGVVERSQSRWVPCHDHEAQADWFAQRAQHRSGEEDGVLE